MIGTKLVQETHVTVSVSWTSVELVSVKFTLEVTWCQVAIESNPPVAGTDKSDRAVTTQHEVAANLVALISQIGRFID